HARSTSDSPLGDIIEGFRWVSRTGPIRALLLLLGLVSLVGMPYTVLMPIFADHVLRSGVRGLGILMGFTGIGALLGALTLADRMGAPIAVATGGVASIAGAIWFGRMLPVFRSEARQLIIAQTMAGGEPAEEMTVRVVQ